MLLGSRRRNTSQYCQKHSRSKSIFSCYPLLSTNWEQIECRPSRRPHSVATSSRSRDGAIQWVISSLEYIDRCFPCQHKQYRKTISMHTQRKGTTRKAQASGALVVSTKNSTNSLCKHFAQDAWGQHSSDCYCNIGWVFQESTRQIESKLLRISPTLKVEPRL